MNGNGGSHGIDAHTKLGGFQCGATSQCHHAGFGRRRVSLLGLSAPSQNGGVVDNDTFTLGLHDFKCCACNPEGACQGHANDFVPVFIGHIDNLFAGAQACVVDKYVNADHGLIGLVN